MSEGWLRLFRPGDHSVRLTRSSMPAERKQTVVHRLDSLMFLSLACAVGVALSLAVHAEQGGPSAEDLNRWLATVDGTKDLVTSYLRYRDPKSPADYDRQNARQAALHHLTESRDGIRVLMAYYLKETSVEFSPPLVEIAGSLVWPIHNGFGKDPRFLSADEVRSILLSSNRAPFRFDIQPIVDSLPFDYLAELQDVWISWLEQVRGECLVPPGKSPATLTADAGLLRTACQALTWTHDPEGIPRVLVILRETPQGVLPYDAIRYLCSMGASDGFGDMVRLLQGEPCNRGVYGDLSVADERQAKALYDVLQCDPKSPFYGRNFPYQGSSYPVGIRSDLCRGIAPFLIRNPKMRTAWEASKDVWFYPIFEYGASALKDSEILGEAKKAEARGDPKLEAFWIDLLGRRDSIVGNDWLIASTKYASGKPQTWQEVPRAASKTLLRRLLGNDSSRLLATINSMPKSERQLLVTQILAGSGWFPQLGPPQLVCGVGMGSDWQKSPPPEPPSMVPLFIRYQDKLLPLMNQVAEPDKLVDTYAVMTSPEARQRFLGILEKGDATAIQASWTLSIEVPVQRLKNLLAQPGLTEGNKAFLLLRLSEEGDSGAYEELKREFLSSPGKAPDALSRFRSAVLDEVTRRKDISALVMAIENTEAKQTAPSSTPKELMPMAYGEIVDLSPQAPLLSRLIRLDPDKAWSYLKQIDLTELKGQVSLLQVASMASSPNAESALKRLEKASQGWASLPPRELETSKIVSLWTYALRTTNTPWCRDQLAKRNDWSTLAELGDPRGASPPCASNRSCGCPNAFLAGDLRQAIACASKQQASERYPRSYVDPGRRVLPIPKWYAREHLGPIMTDFTALFPSLGTRDRMTALSMLPANAECWPDALCATLLKDPFAPVRLTVLMYLLEHPRVSLKAEIRHAEASDPMPWCRRLAHEILVFKPDPFESQRGVRFALPSP